MLSSARITTPDSLYYSAEQWASTALAAHGAGDLHRVAVDAATCLEHLLKACLARRSPALIVDLNRGEQSFPSLLQLLGIADAKPSKRVWTVGLRDAVARMNTFITPPASDDIKTLIDMRDGTIHAASREEVEERLVVAFIHYAETLLEDLDRRRDRFWGDQVEVVDALLAASTDMTERRVKVKMAAAAADYQKRYSAISFDMSAVAHGFAGHDILSGDEDIVDCPVCRSPALAHGYPWVEWNFEQQGDGSYRRADGKVWFWAHSLECSVCVLQLTTHAELLAADLPEKWLVRNADPEEYEEPDYDEQADLQRWLDEQDGPKG